MTVTETVARRTSELDQAIDQEFRREQRLRARDLGLAILTPIVLLALWELAAATGVLDSRLFSPPSAIAERGAIERDRALAR